MSPYQIVYGYNYTIRTGYFKTQIFPLTAFEQQHPARHERKPRVLMPGEGELLAAHEPEGVDAGGDEKLGYQDDRHGERS